jgi:hypothetical protein
MLGGNVRFTQPGAFNDPFELLPEIVMPKGFENGDRGISFDILAARRSPAVGEIVDVEDGYESSDLTSRNIVKELNRQIGILCLSKQSNLLLMWSHYAAQYTGAVIAFDPESPFLSGQIEVDYRPQRPKRDINAYFDTPVPIAELCVKSKEWEYEQEVRVVRNLAECDDTGFRDERGFPVFTQKIPEGCITDVTLGERTPVDDQRAIYAMVRQTAIGLGLAAVDNTGFGFRREVIKYPGIESTKFGPTVSPRTAHIFSELDSSLGEMARWMIDNHWASKTVNNTV